MALSAAVLWLVACAGATGSDEQKVAGSRLSVAAATLPADGSSRLSVDIYLLDKDGKAQVGVPVTLTSAGNITLVQPTTLTDTQGHASGAVYGNVPGNVTLGLAATIGGQRLTAPASAQLTLSPTGLSLGNQLDVHIVPASATVDVSTQREVTVSLLAITGAPVPDVAFTLTSSRGNDTLQSVTGVTDSAGNYSTTLMSTQSGEAAITASIPHVQQSAGTTNFLPGAPDPAHIFVLTAGGNQIISDGNNAATAQIFVGDQYGNPVPLAPLTLGSPNALLSLNPPGGLSNSDGLFTTSILTTQLGSTPIFIQTGAHQAQIPLLGIPGPPNEVQSLLSVSHNTLLADGISSTPIAVTLLDAAGHLRAGDRVVWGSNGLGDTFVPPVSYTDANAVARTTLRSTTSGTSVVTLNGLPQGIRAPVSFFAGGANATTSSFAAGPISPLAGQSVTIFAVIRDIHGNALPGAPWQLSVTGGSLTAADSGLTEASGVLLSRAVFNTLGPQTIHLDLFSESFADVQVNVAPGAATSVTLAYQVDDAPAGTPLDVNMTVYDAYGHIATNFTGTLSFSSTAPNALVPQPYTFTLADAGQHALLGQLRLLEPVSVSAGATLSAVNSDGSGTPSASLAVTAAAAHATAYTACLQSNTTQCLGTATDSPAAGAGLLVSSNRHGIGQALTFYSNDAVEIDGLCVAVAGGSVTQGAALNLASCTHDASMRFVQQGQALVSSGDANLCVDATTNPAVLAACSSPNTQLWSFTAQP